MSVEATVWAYSLTGIRPVVKLLAIYIADSYARYPAPPREPFHLPTSKAANWINCTRTDVSEAVRQLPDAVWRLREDGDLDVHIVRFDEEFPGFGRGAVFEGDDR